MSQHLYRGLLLLYPRSFRREFGDLMVQAFSDRLKERGGLRTWLLVAGDLPVSVSDQIVEVTVMNNRWMAVLAACGAGLFLTLIATGMGSPLIFVGLLTLLLSGLALASAHRHGRPTEFVYPTSPPKTWTWWTVLAILMAAMYLFLSAGQLIEDPKPENVGALGFGLALTALIVGGLRLRSRSRIIGNWMIALAAVPSLVFFWLIFPSVIGLGVIIGAVSEVAQAKPQPSVPA